MKLDNFLLTFILLFQGAIITLLFIGSRDMHEIRQRMDRVEQLSAASIQTTSEPATSPRSFNPQPVFVSIAPSSAPATAPPATTAPPASQSLSSAWIMPHPPGNTGRFVRFESYREQKGLEGQTILVFKEWTGTQFIDTAVPVSEVRWDVKPQ